MKGEKEFDAVELMRKLRRAVDEKLAGKSYEEQRRYLDQHAPLHRPEEQRKKAI